MMANGASHVPPQRRAAASVQRTKTGQFVDGDLRCPKHLDRPLDPGNGTVQRCRACKAKISKPLEGFA